jgi:CubicO group peptidase (beta-lactamase class C family)
MAAALFAVATCATARTTRIDAAELTVGEKPTDIIDNMAFVPERHAAPAHQAFRGTLHLAEVEMTTHPADLKAHQVLGKDAQYFPGFAVDFSTVDGDLVPATEEVIPAGSRRGGRSYWDLIVQPGRVWSEAADQGWSRAAFPFALVHTLEGETHNGLATFLYRGNQVSHLRFQIVQQTTPGHIETYFTAAGVTAASFTPDVRTDWEVIERNYRASVKDAVPIRPWSELERRVGRARLAGFDDGLAAEQTVLTGLDYHGVFYTRGCSSAGGPLPWCDRTRFGVWSVTKAFANEVALLRLAQKYGSGVFDLRIRDYVPEVAAHPEWAQVRFDDCINMATGLGNGTTRRDPNNSEDGYIDDTYYEWGDAPSRSDKVAALLRIAHVYPWGPGEVVRYRDQDMYLLGVAMDQFLKTKEGPSADLWSMLEREVFEPIGIHYAPINRTIEANRTLEARTIEAAGIPGHPLMAYGYYATISDLVKVARLYHDGGRHGGTQLLYGPRIDELKAGTTPRGLPTGEKTRFGETTYFNAFWEMRYNAAGGCKLYIPQMVGWGDNLVALFPGGLTGIRIAHNPPNDSASERDPTAMARVADRLGAFCARDGRS